MTLEHFGYCNRPAKFAAIVRYYPNRSATKKNVVAHGWLEMENIMKSSPEVKRSSFSPSLSHWATKINLHVGLLTKNLVLRHLFIIPKYAVEIWLSDFQFKYCLKHQTPMHYYCYLNDNLPSFKFKRTSQYVNLLSVQTLWVLQSHSFNQVTSLWTRPWPRLNRRRTLSPFLLEMRWNANF